MRCRTCAEPAGWVRRVCRDCERLLEAFKHHRGADIVTMLDCFEATGVARGKIERFLDSTFEGTASVRDHIAADMANELLAAFGQRARKTAVEVQRLRERGAWVHMDRPPEE